jgi:hypothetical protein
MRTIALMALLAAAPGVAGSQQSSNPTRAEQIASAFTKHKQMAVEKHGVRKEKYKDIRSVPLVTDITAYSGVYQVADMGDVLDLRVGSDGRVEADGRDSDRPGHTFVLQNGNITGAVLTGTKVYRDGAREPLEAVFLTRTERNSATDPGVTTTGLGIVLSRPREFGGNTYDKLFYQRQE